MSFFDEADEPRTAAQAPPRRSRSTGGRGTTGGGRRPPSDQQAIQIRRAIAAVAILVVVILIVLGIRSCQISSRNSSLKDYNNSVASIVQESDQASSTLFRQLAGGGGSGGASALQSQINEIRASADAQLSRAQGLSVPDEMKLAHQDVVLALQMRRDGIAGIAGKIQPALGTSANKDAVNSIAADMARFYASDVVYKVYATPLIAAAFHNAGISVGGANGQTIEGGQFLRSIEWLTPSFIASALHVSLPSSKKAAPGLHGHSLDSVSVSGTTLQTGSTNTVPASPAPTFTLHITNAGHFNESNVVCKVSVTGTGDTGQTVVPESVAGQSTTCNVALGAPPPAGTYTVAAQVAPVPGEQNTSNNSLSFPVTFK